jgi:cobalt-precorrin 5A hydrolase
VKTAIVTLSAEGVRIAETLRAGLGGASVFVHEKVEGRGDGTPFASIMALTRDLFPQYERLIFIAPCGAVVRALAPNLRDKREDPAVVVVDAAGRFAISLLSGHEGGANDLSVAVANLLGAEPVVTTTTNALKDVIVGVGCRRGTSAEKIVAAVTGALEKIPMGLSRVRLLASADVKAQEEGLMEAARRLGVPLRIVPSEEIRAAGRDFARSDFVMGKVDLPAVAEPAALLAGRRTRLLLPKTARDGVTVAVAVENCLSSE